MPDYVCKKCGAEFPDAKKKPSCNATKSCANGAFVTMKMAAVVTTTVATPLTPPASYSHDGGAVRLGFNPNSSHKPSGPVYIHLGGKYAIAPDGSTHSGGNACWKGFKLLGQGWTYLGSFDENLNKVDRGANSGGDQRLPQ
jgi:hypothetical protein